ncbi:hypothetical protein PIB30_104689 [Stylosanthes scabra]|uniref:Uncharacterized protein n=1 Tax=Stylosanthes scabra TaxID=79078 RepID=A0ABU6XXI5_9FABA|nr:hypothetical protein [Stylosanthes scabra]
MHYCFRLGITERAVGVMVLVPSSHFSTGEEAAVAKLPPKDFNSLHSFPLPQFLPHLINPLLILVHKALVGGFDRKFPFRIGSPEDSIWAVLRSRRVNKSNLVNDAIRIQVRVCSSGGNSNSHLM